VPLVPMMTVPILIFSIILVITSVALALFVLMHKGRGGGLSDLFGGGISSPLVGHQSQNEISIGSPSSSEWFGWRQSWRSTCFTSWVPKPLTTTGRSF
jgi:protein translocase SecG subunit